MTALSIRARRLVVLAVSTNTRIDVTSWLASLTPGTVSRSRRTVQSAGGKGANVCRALRALGDQPRLVGLAPEAGSRLARLLAADGCGFVPLPHRGSGRVALIILKEDGRVSVVNGQGPSPEDWNVASLLPAVHEQLQRTPAVVCSGSLPPGLPTTTYADVVVAHDVGRPAFIDAAPAVLEATLSSCPDVVTPNIGEAEAVLRGLVDEHAEEVGDDLRERCVEASQRLHERGARRAVVTAGSQGAALTTDLSSWWGGRGSRPRGERDRGGDSFIAGAASAVLRGAGDVEALRHGMAGAAAAVQHETGGMLDAHLVEPALAALPQAEPA